MSLWSLSGCSWILTGHDLDAVDADPNLASANGVMPLLMAIEARLKASESNIREFSGRLGCWSESSRTCRCSRCAWGMELNYCITQMRGQHNSIRHHPRYFILGIDVWWIFLVVIVCLQNACYVPHHCTRRPWFWWSHFDIFFQQIPSQSGWLPSLFASGLF